MNAPLRASIALASFNGAAYLQEQLDSLAGQTIAPFELVVCDDHSTDATVEIVRAFAATCGFPVRLEINPQQLGYRQNFMQAARLCTGDIVLFCDQDDVWQPQKIETVLRAFAEDDVLFAYHNADLYFDDGRLGGPVFDDAAQIRQIAPGDPAPFHRVRGFTQAYRRALHDYDPLWPRSVDQGSEAIEPEAHDLWFLFLALSLGRVRYLPDRLALYRQHARNFSGPTEAAWPHPSGALHELLEAKTRHNGHLAVVAACRSAILADIAANGRPAQRVAAAVQATRYARLASVLKNRAATINAPTLLTRLAAFVRNCLGGGYRRGNPWALRLRWLPQDFLTALRLRA